VKEKICEIYMSETPFDIPCRIKEFISVCEFLLERGVNTFYIYSQDNHKTSVCIEILKLYKTTYPNIKIIKKKEKSNKKIENVVIFNWLNRLIIYDKNFIKINYENKLKDVNVIEDEIDFSGIELMS